MSGRYQKKNTDKDVDEIASWYAARKEETEHWETIIELSEKAFTKDMEAVEMWQPLKDNVTLDQVVLDKVTKMFETVSDLWKKTGDEISKEIAQMDVLSKLPKSARDDLGESNFGDDLGQSKVRDRLNKMRCALINEESEDGMGMLSFMLFEFHKHKSRAFL